MVSDSGVYQSKEVRQHDDGVHHVLLQQSVDRVGEPVGVQVDERQHTRPNIHFL